jgi:YVTN family beta-propeller protein
MKIYLGSLGCLWVLLAIPLSASSSRIYVLNTSGAGISVIDPATNKVVQTLEGIEVPHGIVFSPDGSRAYITDESDHTLAVMDTRTGKIFKKVPLSGRPNLQGITKDGSRIIVCIAEPFPRAAMDIVDTISLEKIRTIPMKAPMHDCYTTNDGKYAVGGSPKGKFLVVIDLQTEQPAWELTFDHSVIPMAFENNLDGSTRRIFVQLGYFNGFAVVDFAERKEVARIKLPDGGLNTNSYIYEGVSHGEEVAPDGKTLWINSDQSNAVFVYSLPDLKLLGHVPLPELELAGHPAITGDPHWLTFTPDGKTVYISITNLKLVVAIDAKTMKVLARIPVGETPRRIGTLLVQ